MLPNLEPAHKARHVDHIITSNTINRDRQGPPINIPPSGTTYTHRRAAQPHQRLGIGPPRPPTRRRQSTHHRENRQHVRNGRTGCSIHAGVTAWDHEAGRGNRERRRVKVLRQREGHARERDGRAFRHQRRRAAVAVPSYGVAAGCGGGGGNSQRQRESRA